jgi:hypothetical protein
MDNRSLQKLYIIAATSFVTGLGCQHIGPGTIPEDRLAYNRAIITSWEQQALLNIVRARYDDLFQFVSVDSIAQTHTRQGSISATLGALLTPWNLPTNIINPSAMASRTTTDSPLISYAPSAGADFIRHLNAPIEPTEIFDLIESGYDAEVFLNLTLYSINDFSSSYSESRFRSSDPIGAASVFARLTRAIKCAHENNDVNFYAGSDANKTLMVVSDKDCESCQISANCKVEPVAFIRRVLHLRAAETKFEIAAAAHPMKQDEIVVRTRSAVAAIRWLSNYVRVPKEHIQKFKINGNEDNTAADGNQPLIVRYSLSKASRCIYRSEISRLLVFNSAEPS